jgi:hypothetical protein
MCHLGEASRIAYVEATDMMVHLLKLKRLFVKTLQDALQPTHVRKQMNQNVVSSVLTYFSYTLLG